MNLGEHRGDGIRHSMHLSAPNGGLAQMLREPNGNWVPYADYAALQAEVERLRKAGDELARVAIPSYILDVKTKAIEAWLEAKGERP